MKLVNIGDFTVDVEQHRIFKQQTELAVEPKVIAVLCYLIQQRERFVSLQELHENVWAGRVVTDTAVRRTISKLRALLQDTDTDNPQFIRSGMKRGYQWLVEPVGLPSPANLEQLASPNLATPANQRFSIVAEAENLTLSDKTDSRSLFAVNHPRWIMLASFGVLVIFLLWLLTNSGSETESESVPLAMPYEVLLDIPGLKNNLAVSADGRWLAFIGNLEGTTGLFLIYLQSGAIQRISTPVDDTVMFVEFVKQDEALIYSNWDGSQSALYKQSLIDLSSPPELITTDEFLIIGHFLNLNEQEVLIGASKGSDQPFSYYLYNFEHASWEPFSVSRDASSIDLSARLSPDKRHIGMIRKSARGSLATILIFDANSHELLQQIPLESNPHRIEWQSDEHLIFQRELKSSRMEQLNIHSREIDFFNVQTAKQQVVRNRLGEWFAITSATKQQGRFYKSDLSLKPSLERLFNLPEDTVQLIFSRDEGWFWMVEQKDSQWVLSHFHALSGEKTKFFETKDALAVIQAHQKESYLLLGLNRRLAVLNINTGKLSLLSNTQQHVSLSHSLMVDDVVYFPEERSGRWVINRYDLNLKEQQQVLMNYRFLAPWNEQFIAMDTNGQYWLLSDELSPLKMLPVKVLADVLPSRSMLVENMLFSIFLNTDMHYDFYQLNLSTLEVTHSRYPQAFFHDLGHLSLTTDELLFRKAPLDDSKIVRMPDLKPLP